MDETAQLAMALDEAQIHARNVESKLVDANQRIERLKAKNERLVKASDDTHLETAQLRKLVHDLRKEAKAAKKPSSAELDRG